MLFSSRNGQWEKDRCYSAQTSRTFLAMARQQQLHLQDQHRDSRYATLVGAQYDLVFFGGVVIFVALLRSDERMMMLQHCWGIQAGVTRRAFVAAHVRDHRLLTTNRGQDEVLNELMAMVAKMAIWVLFCGAWK